MRSVLKFAVLGICLWLARPVQAEREIHVLAVGRGQPATDLYALPEARVLVDRPGHEVALVLLDGGALRWRIEATPGTHVTDIIRSGPGPEDSEILLSGIPMGGVQVSGLPLVFHPRGRNFRRLLDMLADRLGTPRIHSFHGRHQLHRSGLTVDRVDGSKPGLARDYLSDLLDTSANLPPALRAWLAGERPDSAQSVTFDPSGVTLTGNTGSQRFPVPPDVPRVLLPVAAVYAPDDERIYGLTYGGDGYLYSVDVQTGEWSVVGNLQEYDAAGFLYVADERLLILTGAFSRPGDIRGFWLDGRRFSSFIPTLAFPGLSDLFDYGNEHGPPLKPLVFADGWLLAQARGQDRDTAPDQASERLYAIRIETGEVRLLHYR